MTFPLTGLDVRPYLYAPPSSNTIYDLSGVIHHKGSFSSKFLLQIFSGGHYIAYCKKNEMWIEYDDSNVRIVPNSHVAKVQAYILLYSKRRSAHDPDISHDGPESWVSRQWYNRYLHLDYKEPPDSIDVLCLHASIYFIIFELFRT